MTELFLVTGGAGFIGSHITHRLLGDGARVRVLDNLSTGRRTSLRLSDAPAGRLEFIEGDIRDLGTLERAADGAAVIFHQAAVSSVPLSVKDPLHTNDHNVSGTLNVLEAARRCGVRRVVYASSSAVYGDRPELPKSEAQPPAPISPYAVSKLTNEMYAAVWTRLFDVSTVGLRYFNVFGPRQDPASEYAAVIPRFILWALRDEALEVHGEGRQSRDFVYIDDVVDANLRAARAASASGEVFNVGGGTQVSLLDIIQALEKVLGRPLRRRHTPARVGDVPHSRADISKARQLMDYSPTVSLDEGLRRTVEYFAAEVTGSSAS